MSKSTLLKVVNPLLILVFLTQAVSGIFHAAIQEISYEAYEIIHGVGGYIFVLLVIVHFILNWQWIKSNLLKRKR